MNAFVVSRPRTIVAIVGVITLFFAWQARHVRINNSMYEFFPEGHPAIAQDHEVKTLFDTRENLLVGIVHEDGVFRPTTLGKIEAISDAIWNITVADDDDLLSLQRAAAEAPQPVADQLSALADDGLTASDRGPLANILREVGSMRTPDAALLSLLETLDLKLSPITDVVSLSSVENVTGSPEGLAVGPPMETVPATDELARQLAAVVLSNDMFLDGLVTRDGTGTVILAELAFHYDDHIDLAHKVFRELNAIIEPSRGPETIVVAGVPMVNVYMMRYMSGDLARLTPLVILVVFAVIYAAFGSVGAALLPVLVVLASLVWTLGLMGMLGRSITLVVSAMPVMLVAIGVADGVHILNEYRSRWLRSGDVEDAARATMKQLSVPILVTSLTTMAGFLSLASSRLQTIRDFGIFTAFGVLAAMVFSLTVIPAALVLYPPTLRARSRIAAPVDMLVAAVLRGATACLEHRRAVGAAALAAVAVAMGAITQLDVGSMMVGYSRDDNEIVQASAIINSRFGGTEVLDIVIDTKKPGGLKDPHVLGAIAELQDELEELPTVGYTTSLADYIRRINFVMNDDDPAADRIPGGRGSGTHADDRNLIAQYLMLYESVGGEDLTALADYEYQKAHILVQIRTDETPLLRDVRSAADAFAARRFPSSNVYYAGCSNLCIVADELIIPSQIKSLAVAVVIVLGVLMVSFRSWRFSVLGILPLVITLLASFALMAAFGVHLDSVTSVVASIALGIGVDYGVHFLSRYRGIRSSGASVFEALRNTLQTTGGAIVVNALTVAVGFLVLAFSSFWPIVHVGWLVASSMITSALVTIILVPALLPAAQDRVADAGCGGP